MGKTQGHGVGDLHIFRRMGEVREVDGAAKQRGMRSEEHYSRGTSLVCSPKNFCFNQSISIILMFVDDYVCSS